MGGDRLCKKIVWARSMIFNWTYCHVQHTHHSTAHHRTMNWIRCCWNWYSHASIFIWIRVYLASIRQYLTASGNISKSCVRDCFTINNNQDTNANIHVRVRISTRHTTIHGIHACIVYLYRVMYPLPHIKCNAILSVNKACRITLLFEFFNHVRALRWPNCSIYPGLSWRTG